MKKLLTLILLTTLFISCDNDEDTQEYTSFVFHQTVDNNLTNCIASYKKDGKYYKLGDLGDLFKNKYSPEIIIKDTSITEIYFFTGENNRAVRFDTVYTLKKNIKNVFDFTDMIIGIGINDINDPSEYPQ